MEIFVASYGHQNKENTLFKFCSWYFDNFFSNFSCGNESVSRKTSMESVSSNDSIMSDMSTTSSVIMSDLSVATTSDNSELIKSQNGDGKLGSDSNCCTNNNSIPPHEISSEELELLKKLEEQNR